ncbi:MAG: hypothetical protein AMS17_05630 [Spirochaetes bacterium DG_61]|jgi:CRP/FNR family cyclic AMP-dependent transcriptional regulator|nr:MAG: hypothetical protein AMS17_05630 [Spirochaetes bacterium DG_61]
MEKKKFSRGNRICQEGTPGSAMYIILSGRVSIFKMMNAEKIELAVLESGDFCGEMSLLLEGTRTASMEAMTDTEVLILSRESLLSKIQQDPDFALNMVRTMAGRMAAAHEVITRIEGEKKSLEIMYGPH